MRPQATRAPRLPRTGVTTSRTRTRPLHLPLWRTAQARLHRVRHTTIHHPPILPTTRGTRVPIVRCWWLSLGLPRLRVHRWLSGYAHAPTSTLGAGSDRSPVPTPAHAAVDTASRTCYPHHDDQTIRARGPEAVGLRTAQGRGYLLAVWPRWCRHHGPRTPTQRLAPPQPRRTQPASSTRRGPDSSQPRLRMPRQLRTTRHTTPYQRSKVATMVERFGRIE